MVKSGRNHYRFRDISGMKFGELVALHEVRVKNDTHYYWKCKCTCGNICFHRATVLIKGYQKHCNKYCKVRAFKTRLHKKFDSYKKNSKDKGREFKISEDDFKYLIQQKCHYCGYIDKINGLDRIDNSRGYLLDNVVPCCKICNQAKHVFTIHEFNSWIDRLIKHRLGNVGIRIIKTKARTERIREIKS